MIKSVTLYDLEMNEYHVAVGNILSVNPHEKGSRIVLNEVINGTNREIISHIDPPKINAAIRKALAK